MSYPPPPSNYGAPPPGGYGGPPGGYGGGYGPPANQTNGLAIGALVTGLISMLCFPGLALVAIPLGIAALSKAKKLNGSGKGMAIGGIVTGVIGILWGIAFLALVVFAADQVDEIDFYGCEDGTSNQGFPCEELGTEDPDPSDSDGTNDDPPDQICNTDRYFTDPDC